MPPTASAPRPAIHSHDMPAMKNSAPQAMTISIVWPKSGSATSSATTMASRIRAKTLPGMSVRARVLGEQPGDDDDEGRLHELRRLQREAGEVDPAARALDLDADEQRRQHQDERDDEHDQRRAPRLPRRQERGRDHHRQRRQEEGDVALDEMEAVVAEALGDRRAAGERQDDAAEHQDDDADEQVLVDGPPPLGECGLRSARLTIRRPPLWL